MARGLRGLRGGLLNRLRGLSLRLRKLNLGLRRGAHCGWAGLREIAHLGRNGCLARCLDGEGLLRGGRLLRNRRLLSVLGGHLLHKGRRARVNFDFYDVFGFE